MSNKIIIFLTCVLLTSSLAFSNDRLNETKNVLFSSQVEFAKESIEHKCHKVKKKIKKLEDRLHWFEQNQSNEMTEEFKNIRRKEMKNKIKKYEDKIDNLRLMKISLETINFNSI